MNYGGVCRTAPATPGLSKTYNLLPAEKFESLFLAVTFSRCAYSVPEGCDPLAAGPAHQVPPAGQGAGGVPHRHQHPVRGAEGSRRQAPTDAVAAQLLGVIVAILNKFLAQNAKSHLAQPLLYPIARLRHKEAGHTVGHPLLLPHPEAGEDAGVFFGTLPQVS